jgi:hypothetical protein
MLLPCWPRRKKRNSSVSRRNRNASGYNSSASKNVSARKRNKKNACNKRSASGKPSRPRRRSNGRKKQAPMLALSRGKRYNGRDSNWRG